MDAWQSIFLAIGGNAAMLVAIAWLARSLGSQLLSKDIETFKARLTSATSEASERLKHQLQLVAHEHQVRFSKLHERRAEVITALYELLVEAQWAGQSFVSVVEWTGEPPKQEKYVIAMNKFAEFFRAFDKNRIFLPEPICQQLDDFFKEMRTRVVHFGVYIQTDQYAPEHVITQKHEIWSSSSEYFETELPAARKSLENELRSMLA